jgi:hypothetical protein
MNNQFPPPGFMRPDTWAYWMPNSLVGRTLPAPSDGWDSHSPEKARGGILGKLTRPSNEISTNSLATTVLPAPMTAAFWSRLPPFSWSQNGAPPLHDSSAGTTATGIGAETTHIRSAAPTSEAMSVMARTLPSRSAAQPRPPLYGPGDVLLPPPEPAVPTPQKDFRTWLRDALSDANVRYYAGPHLYETLLKLHSLSQLLPGSGTVQSTQHASLAEEEAKAGNYGKAAAHLGLGTLNSALDWLPSSKLAIIAGMLARTFPWKKLATAVEMEAAGKSADEIWRATRLERAADGRWTFEIPDYGYQVHPNVGKRTAAESPSVAPLDDHHAHPGMQEAYPGLSKWKSQLNISPLQEPAGSTNINKKLLTVYAPSSALARWAGIHELKHVIDWFEKHPPGGSPLPFIEAGIPEREAYDWYHRLVGEAAARNAQTRLDWGDRLRERRRPATTEDVPRHRQINLYDE